MSQITSSGDCLRHSTGSNGTSTHVAVSLGHNHLWANAKRSYMQSSTEELITTSLTTTERSMGHGHALLPSLSSAPSDRLHAMVGTVEDNSRVSSLRTIKNIALLLSNHELLH